MQVDTIYAREMNIREEVVSTRSMTITKRPSSFTALLAVIAAAAFVPVSLSAHCDSWDGPVVLEARQAFDAGDVTPVLKWVGQDHEPEIKSAFHKAQAVSEESEAARELAETWFLETLVRVHREGEGAPYTGLKPAGKINPAIQMADNALEDGSAEALADRIGQTISSQIMIRYEKAAEHKAAASESPESGREYVEAYVDYIHFVEGIHSLMHQDTHAH